MRRVLNILMMLQSIGAGDLRLIAGWCQEDKLGRCVCARHFSLTTYLALFEGCSSINVAYLLSNNSKTDSPTFPTLERRALLSPNFISRARSQEPLQAALSELRYSIALNDLLRYNSEYLNRKRIGKDLCAAWRSRIISCFLLTRDLCIFLTIQSQHHRQPACISNCPLSHSLS